MTFGEEKTALRLPVFLIHEAGYQRRATLGCAVLPVFEPVDIGISVPQEKNRIDDWKAGDSRLVAQHPVPLSVDPVIQLQVAVRGIVGVCVGKAADAEPAPPFLVTGRLAVWGGYG